MNKVKDFIIKYKSEILIALAAISSIIASVATMEGADKFICSALIAVIAVIVNALKEGLSEATITLIANAIKIILDELTVEDTIAKDETVAKSARKIVKQELSVEDIKNKLKGM